MPDWIWPIMIVGFFLLMVRIGDVWLRRKPETEEYLRYIKRDRPQTVREISGLMESLSNEKFHFGRMHEDINQLRTRDLVEVTRQNRGGRFETVIRLTERGERFVCTNMQGFTFA